MGFSWMTLMSADAGGAFHLGAACRAARPPHATLQGGAPGGGHPAYGLAGRVPLVYLEEGVHLVRLHLCWSHPLCNKTKMLLLEWPLRRGVAGAGGLSQVGPRQDQPFWFTRTANAQGVTILFVGESAAPSAVARGLFVPSESPYDNTLH